MRPEFLLFSSELKKRSINKISTFSFPLKCSFWARIWVSLLSLSANPFSLVYAYTEIYLQPAVCTFVWAGLRLLAETKQREIKKKWKEWKKIFWIFPKIGEEATCNDKRATTLHRHTKWVRCCSMTTEEGMVHVTQNKSSTTCSLPVILRESTNNLWFVFVEFSVISLLLSFTL